jgi:Ankyrin repeat
MLTAQDDTGYTALYHAADSEHDGIVQLLLIKGAAVDARSRTGVTPLMLAHRVRTITALISAHADASAVDTRDVTVLHSCADQGTAGCVYKLLLEHGAVPTAVDVNGSTPAHVAGMRGYFIDEALLSNAAGEYKKTHSIDMQQSVLTGVQDRGQQGDDVVDNTDSSAISNTSSSCDGVKEVSGAVRSTMQSCSSSSSCEAVNGSMKQKKQKVKQPCANCKKLTTKLCRRCTVVYYCSTECPKVCCEDAKHRAQCAEIASAIV